MSKRGLGLLFYGDEGIGKTSLALQLPGPIKCLSIRESGFEDLDMVGEIPPECINVNVDNWNQLFKELNQAKDFETIIIDSTSGLQQITWEQITAELYKGDSGKFTAYYTGPRQDGPIYMGRVLEKLDIIRANGKNVVLLGHKRVVDMKNPLGADYNCNVLQMDDNVREQVVNWAQAVLYMALNVNIEVNTKMNREKQVTAGKAEASDTRIMYTQKSPAYQAKNRLHLPPIIPLGNSAEQAYQNLYSKLPRKIQEQLAQ